MCSAFRQWAAIPLPMANSIWQCTGRKAERVGKFLTTIFRNICMMELKNVKSLAFTFKINKIHNMKNLLL